MSDRAVAYADSAQTDLNYPVWTSISVVPLLIREDTSFDYWSSQWPNIVSGIALCDGAGNVSAVTTNAATDCPGGDSVVLHRIIDGTHAWCEGQKTLYSRR